MSQLVKIVSSFYENAPALCWCIFFSFVTVLITISLLIQQTIKTNNMAHKTGEVKVLALMTNRGEVFASGIKENYIAMLREAWAYRGGDDFAVLQKVNGTTEAIITDNQNWQVYHDQFIKQMM